MRLTHQEEPRHPDQERILIDYQEARSRILQYLSELNAQSREIAESRKSLTPRERKILGLGPPEDDTAEVVLVEDATIHIDGGWALFCEYKKYLETGDIHDKIVGDGPIIVSSSDGALYPTGSAHPPKFYIKNFEKYGDPHGDATTR